jgi:uncharacterized cofD-like protein
MATATKPKIAVIGGGTGTFVVLSGLKHKPVDLAAIITVADSGGSTGRLRDQFGFLPVGDLRQSLAALAKENDQSWIRELLLYRFSKGQGLKGHNLGNLILTALQDITGSTPKAAEIAEKIFRLKGQILPVTTKNVQLVIHYADGTKKIGEHQLDLTENGGKKITNLTLKPKATVYSKARQALLEADLVIIGPGDLYASLLPNIIVKGMAQAIQRSSAKLVYIVNLMTRYTQTHNMSAQDHLNEVIRFCGRTPDVVIVNSGKIKPKILKLYAQQKEYPVKDDLQPSSQYRIIRDKLASGQMIKKKRGDILPRALIRHDQKKLCKIIYGLLS